jgi:hypothetical protein
VDRILHALIGDQPGAVDAAIKASTLFLTAAVLFASRSAAPSPNSRRSTGSLRSPPEPSSVGILPPAIPRGSTQPWRSFAF